MGTGGLYKKPLRSMVNGSGHMPPSEGGKKSMDLEARCNGNRANIGVLGESYGPYLKGVQYCKLSGGCKDPDCPYAAISKPDNIPEVVDVKISGRKYREFIICTYIP
jgi:hypothetical protein